jgi:hypothetical protein
MATRNMRRKKEIKGSAHQPLLEMLGVHKR